MEGKIIFSEDLKVPVDESKGQGWRSLPVVSGKETTSSKVVVHESWNVESCRVS